MAWVAGNAGNRGSRGSNVVRTTFFTVANRAYEFFVLPHAASVLIHNDDARVEVCLEDADRFAGANAEALAALHARFGKARCLLRDMAWQQQAGAKVPTDAKVAPNSLRFLEVPVVATEYTYIGDIDILTLESVTDKHLRRMARTGLPYSNVLRPNSTAKGALSGLHFTRSDAYYPVRLPPAADFQRDEYLLYQIIVDRGLPLPPPSDGWRPVHGYHLSLSRAPLLRPGWNVDGGLQRPIWNPRRWWRTVWRAHSGRSMFGVRQRFRAYRRLQQNEIWKRLLPHFDERYMRLLGLLDLALLQLLRDGGLRGRFSADYGKHILADRELVRLAAQGAPSAGEGVAPKAGMDGIMLNEINTI